MTYVGIDLAWGERARTGLAVLDNAGRLVNSGSARTDGEIDEWIRIHAPSPRVVGVDAPLIVPNETGMRDCEALIGDAYRRYGAGAYPSNRSRPYFNPPRGAVLAERHGWQIDPSAQQHGVPQCIEVYPHAALVGLFELGYTLGYKKGAVPARRQQLLRLLDLLDGTPSLDTRSSSRWAEVQSVVADAVRPMHLDAVEDEIDAVVCALVAWMYRTQPGTMTVYGDGQKGYIVAPPAPKHRPSARDLGLTPVDDADLGPKIVPAALASASQHPGTASAEPRVDSLTTRLRAFADARDWHQFHTPKNLAMAIAGEAGELAAELQWLDGEESRSAVVEDTALRRRVSQEMADVLIYLVRLADVAGIDLLDAANAKVTINESRFPPPGSAT